MLQKEPTMEIDLKQVDAVLSSYGRRKEFLIPILQDVQALYNWLPREVIRRVAEGLELPLIDVYGVVTFYKSFSLKPRGKHLITVCLGTACHVRGSPRIVDELQRKLKIKPGETTQDREYTLETVNCLGCCAIGPIVVKDGTYYGQMSTQKVVSLLGRE